MTRWLLAASILLVGSPTWAESSCPANLSCNDVKTQLDRPVLGPNHGEPDYPFLGYHGHDAYFCARGPGIVASVGRTTSTMRDLAPTLLTLAGVAPPAFMEGHPFEMMFSS